MTPMWPPIRKHNLNTTMKLLLPKNEQPTRSVCESWWEFLVHPWSRLLELAYLLGLRKVCSSFWRTKRLALWNGQEQIPRTKLLVLCIRRRREIRPPLSMKAIFSKLPGIIIYLSLVDIRKDEGLVGREY